MRRPNERGETLVEVVMALGVLSLVLVSSYALATGTFRLGRGAGQRTQAVNYLQQQAEALRSYRNSTNWDDTFVNKITPYQASQNKWFCMTQIDDPNPLNSGKKIWSPVDSGDAACIVDGIKITIAAQPQSTTIPADQFSFNFKATWKTGVQDNEVTLNTKLVKQ